MIRNRCSQEVELKRSCPPEKGPGGSGVKSGPRQTCFLLGLVFSAQTIAGETKSKRKVETQKHATLVHTRTSIPPISDAQREAQRAPGTINNNNRAQECSWNRQRASRQYGGGHNRYTQRNGAAAASAAGAPSEPAAKQAIRQQKHQQHGRQQRRQTGR